MVAQAEKKLRVELHCHTRSSHDGFITETDLLQECLQKGIELVAITDHDCLGATPLMVQQFAANGVTCVQGCEMTTKTGVHVLGLFVSDVLTGATSEETARHIVNQGGIVGIPHPLKPETGLLAVEPEAVSTRVLQVAHFIELYNGDWRSEGDAARILDVAKRHSLTIVGGSDCHHVWEVGRLVTEFPWSSKHPDAQLFKRVSTRVLELQSSGEVASREQKAKPFGLIQNIRHSALYRSSIKYVPFAVKRSIREIRDSIRSARYRVHPPTIGYQTIYEGAES